MDAKTIMEIKPKLSRFLRQFYSCFGRSTTRQYLPVYIQGQLSALPRKSIEPMADAAGVPARNLQEFLPLISLISIIPIGTPSATLPIKSLRKAWKRWAKPYGHGSHSKADRTDKIRSAMLRRALGVTL